VANLGDQRFLRQGHGVTNIKPRFSWELAIPQHG
jgi:hypothetical protein